MRTDGEGDMDEDFPSWEWYIFLAPPHSRSWDNLDLEKKKTVEFNISKYFIYEVFPKTIHSWVLLNHSIAEYIGGKCKVLKRGACSKRLD